MKQKKNDSSLKQNVSQKFYFLKADDTDTDEEEEDTLPKQKARETSRQFNYMAEEHCREHKDRRWSELRTPLSRQATQKARQNTLDAIKASGGKINIFDFTQNT